jgi:hypothetical protein
MINLGEINIQQIGIHYLHKESEKVVISDQSISLSGDGMAKKLIKGLYHKFSLEVPYEFSKSGVDQNRSAINLIRQKFNEQRSFQEISVELAGLFLESHEAENIKAGYLILLELENIIIEDISCTGLGILRTYESEEFLSPKRMNQFIDIEILQGVSIKNLEINCLIVHEDKIKNTQVFFKNTGLGFKNNFFMDQYLKVVPIINEYHHTQGQINMYKSFVEDELELDSKIEKLNKINDSIQYLKQHDNFQISDFEEEVIKDPETISSFQEFRQNFSDENKIELSDDFIISKNAVKNNTRYVRSVIKLDKNFHVYVHGNRQNIVKGYDDERDLYYYQIYFKEES